MAAGYESFPVFELYPTGKPSSMIRLPGGYHLKNGLDQVTILPEQVILRPGQLLDAHGPWILERPTTQLKDIIIPFSFPDWIVTTSYVVEEPYDYPVYPEDVDI